MKSNPIINCLPDNKYTVQPTCELLYTKESNLRTSLGSAGWGQCEYDSSSGAYIYGASTRYSSKSVFVSGELLLFEWEAPGIGGQIDLYLDTTQHACEVMYNSGWREGIIFKDGQVRQAGMPYVVETFRRFNSVYMFLPQGASVVVGFGYTITRLYQGRFIYSNITDPDNTYQYEGSYVGGYIVPWDGSYRYGKFDFSSFGFSTYAGTYGNYIWQPQILATFFFVNRDDTVSVVRERSLANMTNSQFAGNYNFVDYSNDILYSACVLSYFRNKFTLLTPDLAIYYEPDIVAAFTGKRYVPAKTNFDVNPLTYVSINYLP